MIMPMSKNFVMRSSNKTWLSDNGNKSVEEVSELKAVHNHEINQYFSEVISVIEKGFEDDGQKECFIENVLEQTVGKEVEHSCDRLVSHCIEKLLEECSNPYIIIRFLEAFSHDLSTVCMDQCASHIAEKLLHATLLIVKKLPLASEPADLDRKNDIRTACFFWAYKFGQFCCQNLETCLNDTYGCHVLSSVIQLLGGCHVNESAFNSRRSQSSENSFGVTDIFPAVPLIFLDLINHIGKRIIRYSHLSDLIFDSRSSPVIQNLLLILKKRNLKYFEKVNQVLLSVIFSRRSSEGIPLALCDKSCSFLMEKIIALSDEHEQNLIWLGINQCLPELILHPIGNFTIQKFFYYVHNKQQFESMFDAIIGHFEKILENRYFGIWLSIAKSCNRLKTRQVQFLTKVMQLLKCSEPLERQSYFVPLLLRFQTYEEFQKKIPTVSRTSSFSVVLFGSLITQEILKFSKPFKAVRSMLDIKSDELLFLACQEQGCHILLSFLESTNVAKKDKEKLIKNLKPVFVSIACDFVGNLTLSRMWSLLSVDQKLIIAQELAEKKTLLMEHKWGTAVFKKFALFHFEHDKHKWKEIQNSLEKKQQMFKEIVA